MKMKGMVSMKLFHLSDLHIGLKLFNRDLSEDQDYILKEICSLAKREQPDAVLIAGDIYDKAIPSAEAVSLFDRFLLQLRQNLPKAEIMMISGNHDSAQRLNLFRGILIEDHIHMIGLPPQKPGDHIEKVTLHDSFGPVNFYLLPFVKPSMIKGIVGVDARGSNLSYDESLRSLLELEDIDETERNILVSHQFYLPTGKTADQVDRADSEICTVGNIDQVGADVLKSFDYAALGHIHKPMKVGSEYYRYCGTPIPCSVSEAGQKKGILMVELMEKGTVTVENLPLTPLHEVRILEGLLEDLLKHPSEDYVSIRLTDPEDLDVLDMQDRLRAAFPNLLEIRRTQGLRVDYTMEEDLSQMPDPLQLCCSFLKDPGSEEQELLRQIINEAMEVQV